MPEAQYRHNCGGYLNERDQEGSCKSCGVPIDEHGFEIVQENSKRAIKKALGDEWLSTPQEVIDSINDPELKEIAKNFYETREREKM